MRRDAIFYKIFQRAPGLLFVLLDEPPTQGQQYRFDSVEVKEPTFRIDGVFLPPEDASPKVIYFAEVQFQKDESLYHRFFAESLLYLYRNQTLYDDWHGVIIFYSRSLEPKNTAIHRSLLGGSQVTRVYLDELDAPDQQPMGIRLMQLTIAPEEQAIAQARRLLDQARQEDTTGLTRNEIIEIISTIAVYKFINRSREEVEAMLGLNLEESRVYRDIAAEVERKHKLKMVPRLLAKGISVEEVAEIVELTCDEVRQAHQQPS